MEEKGRAEMGKEKGMCWYSTCNLYGNFLNLVISRGTVRRLVLRGWGIAGDSWSVSYKTLIGMNIFQTEIQPFSSAKPSLLQVSFTAEYWLWEMHSSLLCKCHIAFHYKTFGGREVGVCM